MKLPDRLKAGGKLIKRPCLMKRTTEMNEGIQFLSLGGGVDSTALAMHLCRDEARNLWDLEKNLIKLLNFEWVVFSDPGSEWGQHTNISTQKKSVESWTQLQDRLLHLQRYFRHKTMNESGLAVPSSLKRGEGELGKVD